VERETLHSLLTFVMECRDSRIHRQSNQVLTTGTESLTVTEDKQLLKEQAMYCFDWCSTEFPIEFPVKSLVKKLPGR
jgi:hypothetical protein